jgi:hypothetical protein
MVLIAIVKSPFKGGPSERPRFMPGKLGRSGKGSRSALSFACG